MLWGTSRRSAAALRTGSRRQQFANGVVDEFSVGLVLRGITPGETRLGKEQSDPVRRGNFAAQLMRHDGRYGALFAGAGALEPPRSRGQV
jgi:hypothetical protein